MDWKTWSPFQSEKVRQICAHMTSAEKTATTLRGALYGFWTAATFAIPIGIITAQFLFAGRNAVVIVGAAILIAIHSACIPLWQQAQRRFLCNTSWAREQGFDPDQLKLFGSRRNSAPQ